MSRLPAWPLSDLRRSLATGVISVHDWRVLGVKAGKMWYDIAVSMYFGRVKFSILLDFGVSKLKQYGVSKLKQYGYFTVEYMHTYIHTYIARQHLRSARRQLMDVPRHRRTTFGRRAFSVTGPTVWNSLSNTLREQSDEDSFKRQLKTFLFSRTLGLAYPAH